MDQATARVMQPSSTMPRPMVYQAPGSSPAPVEAVPPAESPTPAVPVDLGIPQALADRFFVCDHDLMVCTFDATGDNPATLESVIRVLKRIFHLPVETDDGSETGCGGNDVTVWHAGRLQACLVRDDAAVRYSGHKPEPRVIDCRPTRVVCAVSKPG